MHLMKNAEFNFKLLNNYWKCNYNVIKWNKDVGKSRRSCEQIDNFDISNAIQEKVSQNIEVECTIKNYFCSIL